MKSSDDFIQISPTQLPSSTAYANLQADFQTALSASNTQWPEGLRQAANPYPFYTPPERIVELQSLQSALHTAVVTIIQNWWSTPRYQAVIPTSSKIERVLRSLEHRRPYTNTGSYRPDFLTPSENDQPLTICEINARFAFNGFMMAEYIQNYFDQVGFEGSMKGYKSTSKGILAAYSGLFDKTKPLALVKGRESGYCIHLFHHCYTNSRFVDPKDLKLVPCSKSTSGYTLADSFGTIEQIALELHQDELESLDENILLEVGARCQNDLRTIFFMHDKRMLGLLRQEVDNLVSSSLLTPNQADALQSGVVETHLPGSASFQNIMDKPHERHLWLLKPCLSGKGDGIVFGKDVDEETWRAMLQSTLEQRQTEYCPTSTRRPYILQRHIIQKKHSILVGPEKPNEPPRQVNWFVVGTMFCINKDFLGVSVWRTSPNDITAVSRGGTYMAGVTSNTAFMVGPRSSHINQSIPNTPSSLEVPNAARIHLGSIDISPNQIRTIKHALKSYGLAVIDLGFSDPTSACMLNLARTLGTTIDHSKTNDPLWDVKPKSGAELARSQTSNSFPWHTDCSFDTSPPRYFALHVIRADRCGGGKLRVLPVDSLLKVLSPATLQTLKQPLFRIRVPKEFHKDVTHVIGALVASDTKIRYRREIIEPLDNQAEKALNELEEVLQSSEIYGWAKVLGTDTMKDGVVVCLDNARFMHARSEVRDPERWLRRVRWGPEKF